MLNVSPKARWPRPTQRIQRYVLSVGVRVVSAGRRFYSWLDVYTPLCCLSDTFNTLPNVISRALVLLSLTAGLTGVLSVKAAAQALIVDDATLVKVQSRYGELAKLRVLQWRDLMLADMALPVSSPDSTKMTNANNFFNQVRWISDLEHWGKEDYWATPIEMLGTDGGDCEDFSIAKYLTLKQTGVLNDRLRITYVKALDYNQAHMVLAYYPTPDAEPLILDNINKTILPASERDDLVPVYSFNGDGLWLAKSRSRKLPASKSTMPQWFDVQQRISETLRQSQ